MEVRRKGKTCQQNPLLPKLARGISPTYLRTITINSAFHHEERLQSIFV
jgi:hypothetical protein